MEKGIEARIIAYS